MLVASVRTATDMEAAAAVLGKALGLTLAEARIRLAPEPPAILASMEPGAAEALVAELRRVGLVALAVEGGAAAEGSRVVARTAVLGATGGSFQARTGAPVELPWAEVASVLRAASSVRAETAVTQQTKQFSLSTAIATQGLKMNQTVERTARTQQEETEQVVVLHGRGGQRVLLRERELDFSCLGPAKQPTRTANMGALWLLLKQKAPGAFHDERLLRLGRRPLPMFLGGETLTKEGKVAQTRSDTASGMELLAEVLFRAVSAGLLP